MRINRHPGCMLDGTGSIGNYRIGITPLPLPLLSVRFLHSDNIRVLHSHIWFRHDE
jgi:hypothetical protein